MKEAIKIKVMDLLNNYMINQQKIAVLRYEMEHPSAITPTEMIDAMSFGHQADGMPAQGHISNKTLYIALNYQEKMDSINQESAEAIATQLWELEREYDRLNYYLSVLPSSDADIIRAVYFEGKTSEQIAAPLGVAPRTIRDAKARAVDHLCEMYEFTDGLH